MINTWMLTCSQTWLFHSCTITALHCWLKSDFMNYPVWSRVWCSLWQHTGCDSVLSSGVLQPCCSAAETTGDMLTCSPHVLDSELWRGLTPQLPELPPVILTEEISWGGGRWCPEIWATSQRKVNQRNNSLYCTGRWNNTLHVDAKNICRVLPSCTPSALLTANCSRTGIDSSLV